MNKHDRYNKSEKGRATQKRYRDKKRIKERVCKSCGNKFSQPVRVGRPSIKCDTCKRKEGDRKYMIWCEDNIAMINDIYPDDSDREYHRYLETGEISTIADYDLQDWPYEINDPKHPNYHSTFADIADLEDIPF